jgi:hypothetical protein
VLYFTNQDLGLQMSNKKKGAKNMAKAMELHRCWICGMRGHIEPKTMITVTHEKPGGKECPPKEVRVHFDCLMPSED